MARLRGSRATPDYQQHPGITLGPDGKNDDASKERLMVAHGYTPVQAGELVRAPWPVDPRRYEDAVREVLDQVTKLGLDSDLDLPRDVTRDLADAVRYVYAQGWLACESRLAAPNMADAIDLALTTPAAIVEQLSGESLHRWTIRAVQNIVAHGATSERKTAV